VCGGGEGRLTSLKTPSSPLLLQAASSFLLLFLPRSFARENSADQRRDPVVLVFSECVCPRRLKPLFPVEVGGGPATVAMETHLSFFAYSLLSEGGAGPTLEPQKASWKGGWVQMVFWVLPAPASAQ
jgi:hypothetical protein